MEKFNLKTIYINFTKTIKKEFEEIQLLVHPLRNLQQIIYQWYHRKFDDFSPVRINIIGIF